VILVDFVKLIIPFIMCERVQIVSLRIFILLLGDIFLKSLDPLIYLLCFENTLMVINFKILKYLKLFLKYQNSVFLIFSREQPIELSKETSLIFNLFKNVYGRSYEH